MNKIDTIVKNLLLTHPTLFHNRFEAFVELMTNSCYEWDDSGNLIPVFGIEELTPEQAIADAREKLEQTKKEFKRRQDPALDELHRRYLLEAEKEFLDTEFIANHINLYATQFTCCDVQVIWGFLWHCERRGISKYWSVNNKPDNIDEEWRLAIREWFEEMLAPLNNLMGTCSRDGSVDWHAIPKYATTFNWIKDTYKSYETEEDRAHCADMVRIANEIVSEIIQKEKNNGGV